MTNTELFFVKLLRASMMIDSSITEMPLEIDLNSIVTLARKNHLEVAVAKSLENVDFLSEDIKKALYDHTNSMIARDVKQTHCLNLIKRKLDSNNIAYAVLKGGVLKQDYPLTYMRFMSDLDFYIKSEDRESIHKSITEIGGVYKGTESGDEQFAFWDSVGVEFHGRLLYRMKNGGLEIYPERNMLENDQVREEYYALNLLGHAVYNLANAGLGIRYVLDIWIYRNRHANQPNWDYVYKRLKEDGIYEAAINVINLSDMLFGDMESTPLLEEMADYLFEGGLYGNIERGLASQIATTGGKGKAILKQVVRNRKEYENRFPWLIKYPFFLPVAWIMRLTHSVMTHYKVIGSWLKGMLMVSDDTTKMQRERLNRFGLKI